MAENLTSCYQDKKKKIKIIWDPVWAKETKIPHTKIYPVQNSAYNISFFSIHGTTIH